MKKINIIYWTVTGLFAAFMIFSSIGNVTSDEQSVAFISGALGYPEYMIPFLGVAKILGAITILIPGFPRLKEWAYAGLAFDLAGAIYSIIVTSGGIKPDMGFMILPVGFLVASYFLYHKREQMRNELNNSAAHVRSTVNA
jgi:uncharacterized membrane protein YphA (DoxX/SURF4 family)